MHSNHPLRLSATGFALRHMAGLAERQTGNTDVRRAMYNSCSYSYSL